MLLLLLLFLLQFQPLLLLLLLFLLQFQPLLLLLLPFLLQFQPLLLLLLLLYPLLVWLLLLLLFIIVVLLLFYSCSLCCCSFADGTEATVYLRSNIIGFLFLLPSSYTQIFHFWRESKRLQSVPLGQYVTYVSLPWWAILKEVLEKRSTPLLTF